MKLSSCTAWWFYLENASCRILQNYYADAIHTLHRATIFRGVSLRPVPKKCLQGNSLHLTARQAFCVTVFCGTSIFVGACFKIEFNIENKISSELSQDLWTHDRYTPSEKKSLGCTLLINGTENESETSGHVQRVQERLFQFIAEHSRTKVAM